MVAVRRRWIVAGMITDPIRGKLMIRLSAVTPGFGVSLCLQRFALRPVTCHQDADRSAWAVRPYDMAKRKRRHGQEYLDRSAFGRALTGRAER